MTSDELAPIEPSISQWGDHSIAIEINEHAISAIAWAILATIVYGIIPLLGGG